MRKKIIPWKTWLFLGMSLCPVIGYTLSKKPSLIMNFWTLGIIGIAMSISIYFFIRKEITNPNFSPAGVIVGCFLRLGLWCVGAIVSGVLILKIGQRQYTSALDQLNASGYVADFPKNDIVDLTRKNGMVISNDFSDPKIFRLTDGDPKISGDKGITADIGAAMKKMRGETFDVKAVDRLLSHRKEWASALKTMDAVQKAPVFSWNAKYDRRLLEIKIPRFAGYLRMIRLLSVEAMFLVEEGKSKEAARRLDQGFWLAIQVTRNQTVIGSMIAAAMQGILLDASMPIIRKGDGHFLLSSLREGEYQRALEKSIRYEIFKLPGDTLDFEYRDFSFTPFQYFMQYRPMEAIKNEVYSFFRFPWIRWESASTIREGLKASECMKMRPSLAFECLRDQTERVEKSGWLLQSIGSSYRQEFYFKGIVTTARERMTYAAFAAEKFMKTNGYWPDDIQQLKLGERGIDPLTEKNFVTKKTKQGFEIWFYGQDGKQNSPENSSNLYRDYVVRL